MKLRLLVSWLALLLLLAVVVAAAGGGGSPVVVKEESTPPLVAGNYTPEEASDLKCSTLGTIYERVSCRVDLEQENELNYLPEECRALNGTEREDCKSFYASVQHCWNEENMDDPVLCARSQLGLSADVETDVNNCSGDESCLASVAEKVHRLTKFRIYNLEWKAEYIAEEDGVEISHELLVDLVRNLELKKQEYNWASTIEEKKAVVREARQIWRGFADKIRGQLGI